MGAFDDIEGELAAERAWADKRERERDEFVQSQFASLARLASEFASFAADRGFPLAPLLDRGGPRECWLVTLSAADLEKNLHLPIGVLRSGEWLVLERGAKTNLFGTTKAVGWQPRPDRGIRGIEQYDIEKSFRDAVARHVGGT